MNIWVRREISFQVGIVSAFLTWLIFGGHANPISIGPSLNFIFAILSFLLIPGMFLSLLASTNVHLISVWMGIIGNFIVYFCVANIVLSKWAKHHGP